jgi:hypothetical protein
MLVLTRHASQFSHAGGGAKIRDQVGPELVVTLNFMANLLLQRFVAYRPPLFPHSPTRQAALMHTASVLCQSQKAMQRRVTLRYSVDFFSPLG